MPTRRRSGPRTDLTPYQASIDILSRRDCSAKEMARLLKRRGYDEEQIEPVLTRLASQRLIDDASLAERYARSRSERGYGRRRILLGLRARGVSKTLTDEAVKGVVAQDLEPATIDRLAAACWKRHARVEGKKRLARVFAYLVRRGFPPSLVRERLHSRHPGAAGTLEDSP